MLKTQGSSSLKDNIINVFGPSTFLCLESFNLSVTDNCRVEGFLSKLGNGNGRNLGDRQFFYINGRPVDMPKVSKLVNEIYRCSNSKQYPIAIMNFLVSTKACDVNVTPDKRKVFFSDEGSLVLSLREAIEKFYSPNQCSYLVNRVEDSKDEKHESEMILSLKDRESPSQSNQCSYLVNKIEDSKVEKYESDMIVSLNDNESPSLSNPLPSPNRSETLKEDSELVLNVVKEKTWSEDLVSKDLTPDIAKLSPKGIFTACQDIQENDVCVSLGQTSSYPLFLGRVKDKMEKASSSSQSNVVQSSLLKFVTVNKRKYDDSFSVLSEMPVLRDRINSCQTRKITSQMYTSFSDEFDYDTPDADKSVCPEISLSNGADINHKWSTMV